MDFREPVIDIVKRSHDVTSFRFKRPEGFDYKPGQYVLITLEIEGEAASKPFTLSSSPTEKDHIEFTKKFTGHVFSNALQDLQIGDTVTISKPYGKFTFEGEYEKIALLSGGIGITPMVSICKFCTDMELSTDIIMVCSNKTEADIIFSDDLEKMKERNPGLSVVDTLTRASEKWDGCSGRICDTLVAREVPDYQERVFYVCGPPAMVESMMDMLRSMNVPDGSVKKESLLGY